MHAEPSSKRPLLVQVAPPGQGGVFDYAQCLKSEWAAQGISTHSLTLSKELARQRSLVQRIRDLHDDTSQPCSLVLHFSGYGYGHRGICFWLLNELRALRAQRASALRLVVVFHELFASGPPWRSAFWLSPVQASLARQLARMSDALWTNTDQHAQWLRQSVDATKPIVVRAVFSNVGEPAATPAHDHRQPTGVIFGSVSTRQRVFDELRGREATLRGLGIDTLVEVGNGATTSPEPGSIPCRHLGRLDLPELRRLLEGSRFGLLDYPSQFLGKSSVFAAYATHGCVILDTSAPGPDTDGLTAGTDYLSLPAMLPARAAPATFDAIATRAALWYSKHRLADQARDLLALAEIA